LCVSKGKTAGATWRAAAALREIVEGIEKINFVIENLAAPCFEGPAPCAEIVQHPTIGEDALLLRQEMLI
jgi:hypothetical protein